MCTPRACVRAAKPAAAPAARRRRRRRLESVCEHRVKGLSLSLPLLQQEELEQEEAAAAAAAAATLPFPILSLRLKEGCHDDAHTDKAAAAEAERTNSCSPFLSIALARSFTPDPICAPLSSSFVRRTLTGETQPAVVQWMEASWKDTIHWSLILLAGP